MKLGVIGEEMAATAVKPPTSIVRRSRRCSSSSCRSSCRLDAPMPDAEARAAASLEEASALGADHGVEVQGTTVRARAIGKRDRRAGPATRAPT